MVPRLEQLTARVVPPEPDIVLPPETRTTTASSWSSPEMKEQSPAKHAPAAPRPLLDLYPVPRFLRAAQSVFLTSKLRRAAHDVAQEEAPATIAHEESSIGANGDHSPVRTDGRFEGPIGANGGHDANEEPSGANGDVANEEPSGANADVAPEQDFCDFSEQFLVLDEDTGALEEGGAAPSSDTDRPPLSPRREVPLRPEKTSSTWEKVGENDCAASEGGENETMNMLPPTPAAVSDFRKWLHQYDVLVMKNLNRQEEAPASAKGTSSLWPVLRTSLDNAGADLYLRPRNFYL